MSLQRFHDGASLRLGIPIGKLVIAKDRDGWGIFKNTARVKFAGDVIPRRFLKKDDAEYLANKINTLWNIKTNFLAIWDVDPTLDPFFLGRWSSKAHLTSYCLLKEIEKLPKYVITLSDVETCLPEVDKQVIWWAGNFPWTSDINNEALGVL